MPGATVTLSKVPEKERTELPAGRCRDKAKLISWSRMRCLSPVGTSQTTASAILPSCSTSWHQQNISRSTSASLRPAVLLGNAAAQTSRPRTRGRLSRRLHLLQMAPGPQPAGLGWRPHEHECGPIGCQPQIYPSSHPQAGCCAAAHAHGWRGCRLPGELCSQYCVPVICVTSDVTSGACRVTDRSACQGWTAYLQGASSATPRELSTLTGNET